MKAAANRHFLAEIFPGIKIFFLRWPFVRTILPAGCIIELKEHSIDKNE